LGKLASALSLNVLAFVSGGSLAFAHHTEGIEGGGFAQPWVMVVLVFGLVGLACLGLLWAFRAGHLRDVEEGKQRPLEVEDEETVRNLILELEEE